MYNEEMVVEKCYERVNKVLEELKQYESEIIVVDDGSKDKTIQILEEITKKDEKVKVISFSRNFGHQAAVTAGLKETTGDAVIIIDADMQDPPELIKEMVMLWEEGNDIVYAVREKRKGESIFKVLSAFIAAPLSP